ncbi:MAG: hypothetical protein AAB596_00065 [Patescibacteria group bacterium]
MIIFLYGPDSYRRRKKGKEILEKYKKNHLTWKYFDFGEGSALEEFERFKEFAISSSIFENAKLAVMENIFSGFDSDGLKEFLKFLKPRLNDENLTIVISEEKVPLKDWEFLLKQPVLFQEFKNMSHNQFEFFIKKESEVRGLVLAPQAVEFLAEIFSGNSWALINDLERLSLFDLKKFDLQKIKETADYYQALVFEDFFSYINVFLGQHQPLKHKIISLELLLEKEDSAKIFNFLVSRAKKNLPLIKKFADYDASVKSGKLDYEEAILDFALSDA